MRPGKLDRRITLERFTSTTNSYGEQIKAWATLATVWAQYTPASDGERWREAQVERQLTGRFVIRYSAAPDLTTEDRLQFEGKTYAITGVKEIERRRWLEITAGASDAR